MSRRTPRRFSPFLAAARACYAWLAVVGLLPASANVSDPVEPRDRVAPVVSPKAVPFPLSAVRLLPGPFRKAMEADTRYLLSLDPDRQLAPFRAAAGLPVKAASYGGWDRSGLNLGHYLVAACHAWKATDNAELRARIERLMVGLLECQDARDSGYLSGLKDMDAFWQKVVDGDFEARPLKLNGRGAPLYVYHKMLDGLLHVYRSTGDERALKVTCRFADWIESTFAPMREEQFQRLLTTEQGGMVEALADVYAATGEPRYLALARRFRHRRVLRPLAGERDELAGHHGNSTVVKLLGEARLYELCGDRDARTAAEFFLRQVLEQHCYAHGGYTDNEAFGPPGKLAGRMGHQSAETCKTYNLLKLLRHAYSWQPDHALFDYYEGALYNHILASINPGENGAFVYYMTVRPGDMKVYSRPYDNFWCCVSTGQENHVKYAESIYWHDEDGVWVNLFIPSELDWAERGVRLRQETDFPRESRTRLRVFAKRPTDFALRLRCPAWTSEAIEVRVNGKALTPRPTPGRYVIISRTWKDGDIVDMLLPQPLRSVSMPDLASRVAVFRGPVLLAADLGDVATPPWGPFHLVGGDPKDPKDWPVDVEIPVLATGDAPPSTWFENVSGDPLRYRARSGVGWPGPVMFIPLYDLHRRRMAIYLDTVDSSPESMVDLVRIGDPYSEYQRHNLRGEGHETGPGPLGRAWRDAREGWFAYDLACPAGNAPLQLIVTYWGGDGQMGHTPRSFTVLADGVEIGRENLEARHAGRFFERAYPVPAHAGAEAVEIRFKANAGAVAGGVYGVRLVLGGR